MSKRTDVKKAHKRAKQNIINADRLLRQGVSISSIQAEALEKKRLEYLDGMNDDGTKAEAIMSSYAMSVYQSYLPEVSKKYLPVVDGGEFNAVNRIRYFDITKWVIDPEEKNMDKLVNVYQVLSQEECNIALIYQRSNSESTATLAVSNTSKTDMPGIANQFIERIEKSIKGNFPGVQITKTEEGVPVNLWEADKNDSEKNFYYSVAAISNLASDKSEDFVSQNIEKLLDGM